MSQITNMRCVPKSICRTPFEARSRAGSWLGSGLTEGLECTLLGTLHVYR